MGLRSATAQLVRAAADLAVGSSCAGCDGPPGMMCPDCWAELTGPATLGWVPGMADVGLAAAGPYGDVARSAIIGHKERGRLPLARPLGDALAVAVTALTASERACGHPPGRPVCLVPVPSVRAATRRRGHDPVARVARRAATTLRRVGQPGTVVAALRHVRSVADQAGLDREAREDNLRGALSMRAAADRLFGDHCVVIVDDVVTTGASIRESVRAMQRAGVESCGAAVIAVAR